MKIQNVTGANPTGVIRTSIAYSTPDPSQNTGLFHCLSGENYIFASPRFNVNKAKCWDTGVNIWSVLDSEYNYPGIQNCATNSGILPSKYWFTGVWSSFISNRYSNLRFTKLYPHNQTVKNLSFVEQSYLLSINTGYNFNLVSGVPNLNTGEQFIFNFEGISFTGVASRKSNGNILGSINGLDREYAHFYYNTGQNGIQFITIRLSNRNIEYEISKSGSNTVFKKMSISRSEISCATHLNK